MDNNIIFIDPKINLKIKDNLDEEEGPYECAYECDICQEKFKEKSNLKLHMTFHDRYTNKDYTCKICHKSFTDKRYLHSHMKRHEGIKRYECHICNKKFYTGYDVRRHLSVHFKQTRVTVSDIQKTNQFQTSLPSNSKIHQCSTCDKVFSTRSSLRHHEQIHPLPNRIKTDFINDQEIDTKEDDFDPILSNNGYDFSSSQDSVNISYIDVDELTKEPMICNFCKKTFDDIDALEEHLFTHERKYVCDLCNLNFKDLDRYDSHFCIHMNEKYGIICPICYKSFESNSDLKNHYSVHPKETLYECQICYQKFKYLEHLNRHETVHRGRFINRECKECGQIFASLLDLAFHYKSHKGNKKNNQKDSIVKKRKFIDDYESGESENDFDFNKFSKSIYTNPKVSKYACIDSDNHLEYASEDGKSYRRNLDYHDFKGLENSTINYHLSDSEKLYNHQKNKGKIQINMTIEKHKTNFIKVKMGKDIFNFDKNPITTNNKNVHNYQHTKRKKLNNVIENESNSDVEIIDDLDDLTENIRKIPYKICENESDIDLEVEDDSSKTSHPIKSEEKVTLISHSNLSLNKNKSKTISPEIEAVNCIKIKTENKSDDSDSDELVVDDVPELPFEKDINKKTDSSSSTVNNKDNNKLNEPSQRSSSTDKSHNLKNLIVEKTLNAADKAVGFPVEDIKKEMDVHASDDIDINTSHKTTSCNESESNLNCDVNIEEDESDSDVDILNDTNEDTKISIMNKIESESSSKLINHSKESENLMGQNIVITHVKIEDEIDITENDTYDLINVSNCDNQIKKICTTAEKKSPILSDSSLELGTNISKTVSEKLIENCNLEAANEGTIKSDTLDIEDVDILDSEDSEDHTIPVTIQKSKNVILSDDGSSLSPVAAPTTDLSANEGVIKSDTLDIEDLNILDSEDSEEKIIQVSKQKSKNVILSDDDNSLLPVAAPTTDLSANEDVVKSDTLDIEDLDILDSEDSEENIIQVSKQKSKKVILSDSGSSSTSLEASTTDLSEDTGNSNNNKTPTALAQNKTDNINVKDVSSTNDKEKNKSVMEPENVDDSSDINILSENNKIGFVNNDFEFVYLDCDNVNKFYAEDPNKNSKTVNKVIDISETDNTPRIVVTNLKQASTVNKLSLLDAITQLTKHCPK